jgi:PKD repeat protein
MIVNVHIVRKALVYVFLLIVLTAGLTIFGAAAFAQNYGAGLQSAPSVGSAGNAIVPGDSGTTMQTSPPSKSGNAIQVGITATLLGVPVYGTAPLMVDFYVGLASPNGSLVYHWNFGDGAVSLLPASVFMIHVYQHPGTYFCSLALTNAQGRSTTLLTTITVKPRKG